MTWQVEQARLASQAPSNSTSFSFAISRMCFPFSASTSFFVPSRSTKLNLIIFENENLVSLPRACIHLIGNYNGRYDNHEDSPNFCLRGSHSCEKYSQKRLLGGLFMVLGSTQIHSIEKYFLVGLVGVSGDEKGTNLAPATQYCGANSQPLQVQMIYNLQPQQLQPFEPAAVPLTAIVQVDQEAYFWIVIVLPIRESTQYAVEQGEEEAHWQVAPCPKSILVEPVALEVAQQFPVDESAKADREGVIVIALPS